MTPPARILWFGSAAALVAVGIACAAALSSTAGQVVGLTLIGFGCVLATGLVFFEVGLSEDRERARAERAAEKPRSPPHKQQSTPRLERLRGSRRRLR